MPWAIGHDIMHVLVNISSTPCGFPGLLFRMQCFQQHLFDSSNKLVFSKLQQARLDAASCTCLLL